MNWPSWAEVLLTMTGIGGAIKWWTERRDRTSELSRAKTKALETVDVLNETIETKNTELQAKDVRIRHLESLLESRERRIDELEDRLYAGGGPR